MFKIKSIGRKKNELQQEELVKKKIILQNWCLRSENVFEKNEMQTIQYNNLKRIQKLFGKKEIRNL